MGLEFTNIADKTGVAIYMIHDGTMNQQRSIERLAEEVAAKDPHRQIVVLSARDKEAEKIRTFYGLSSIGFPYILVVADDDRLLHSWSGLHVPTADHVAHTAGVF